MTISPYTIAIEAKGALHLEDKLGSPDLSSLKRDDSKDKVEQAGVSGLDLLSIYTIWVYSPLSTSIDSYVRKRSIARSMHSKCLVKAGSAVNAQSCIDKA